jgi:hypothetical protein
LDKCWEMPGRRPQATDLEAMLMAFHASLEGESAAHRTQSDSQLHRLECLTSAVKSINQRQVCRGTAQRAGSPCPWAAMTRGAPVSEPSLAQAIHSQSRLFGAYKYSMLYSVGQHHSNGYRDTECAWLGLRFAPCSDQTREARTAAHRERRGALPDLAARADHLRGLGRVSGSDWLWLWLTDVTDLIHLTTEIRNNEIYESIHSTSSGDSN